MSRVLSLASIGTFLIVGCLWPKAATAEAIATTYRTGEHPGKTRFVLELTEKPEYKIFTLDHPYRVVIDFTDVEWRVPPSLGKRGRGVIGRIRNGSPHPGVHRVVLDLSGPAQVQKAFLLEPDNGFPWLFVLDLRGTSRAVFLAARAPREQAVAPSPVRAAMPHPLDQALVQAPTPAPTQSPAPAPAPAEVTAVQPPRPTMIPPTSSTESRPETRPETGTETGTGTERADRRDTPSTLASLMKGFELSGNIELEGRGFPYDGRTANFGRADYSVSAEVKFEKYWDNDRQSFTFVPFYRFDDKDNKRSHFDIRELRWIGAFGDYEVKVGMDRVFWGVTEAVHLIDIINQTDLVEDFDQEDKLGQFMVNVSYLNDLGTFEFYVLPGFRPRTFGGARTRPSNGFRIATEHERYQSGAKARHVDYAVRWSQTFDEWDVGLAHFYGTSREPRFLFEFDSRGPVLTPLYDQINQTSLDLQWTHEAWLLKFEGLRRSGQGKTFYAQASGFEYTFFGVFDSAADLGLVGEYLFDDRGDNAPTPFENDMFIGGRWTANDIQDLNILAGVIFDLDSNARFASIEASRRLGNSWKLSLEVRLFDSIPAKDPIFPLRADDYIELSLARFF